MATMQDLFSPLFIYVLLLEQAPLSGQPQRSYEDVRDAIASLLEQARTEARRQSVPEADYQEACFAVVAWIDETILKSSWAHRNRWQTAPLQEAYFHTKNAGEELFQRLHKLRPEHKDLREVYYLCLGLGFSGQYFLADDAPKLARERLEQAPHLPLPVAELRDVHKITPQPYDVPAPEGELPRPPWTQRLVKVGLALLVLLPLAGFLLYRYMPTPQSELTVTKAGHGSGTVTSTPAGIACGMTCTGTYPRGEKLALMAVPEPGSVFSGWSGDPGCASGTVTMTANKTCTATFNTTSVPPAAPTPVPAPAPVSTLTAAMLLSRLQGQYPCARVTVEGLDAQTGSVQLGGRVASDEQRSDVRRVVQEVSGVTRVTDTLQVIPRPFCEVLEVLEPFQERNTQQALGLTARLNKVGSHPVYVQDDQLVVEVKTPGGFESYLYVDYYGTDAVVNHMFPDPQLLPKPWSKVFKAQSNFTVDGGAQAWKIGPPFGLELVTVIASKRPLVAWPRQGSESVESYVSELRRVLPKDPAQADVAAVFYFFTTRGRP